MRAWLQHIPRGKARQLFMLGIIAVITLLTFNTIFAASTPDDYPREIIAALIGTLMAAIVTTLLLKEQTAGEETRERNVEIFRRKVDVYREFAAQVSESSEDGEFSVAELSALRRTLHHMALLSEPASVELAAAYVRQKAFPDEFDGASMTLAGVLDGFRKELGLAELAEALTDLDVVEQRIAGKITADISNEAAAILQGIKNQLVANLEVLGVELDFGETFDVVPAGDGCSAGITTKAGVSYGFYVSYDNISRVDGDLGLENFSRKQLAALKKAASPLGFATVNDPDYENLFPFSLETEKKVFPYDSEKLGNFDTESLSQAVSDLEKAALKLKSTRGPLADE